MKPDEVIYPWGSPRRFNAYSDYFRRLFGERVQKITIDAGFTCPNRDGSCGSGGCTFCDNHAFNPSYNTPDKTVVTQIMEGIDFHRKRYRKVTKYLAYFQAYTNTYASVEELKALYEPALTVPGVVGIVIGTRPDCISSQLLDYLEELSQRTFLVVEYGIESTLDSTLQEVNRGHDFATSVKAIRETAARGIRTGGHMIIGLPGETREDWLEGAGILSSLPLHSIKYHHLQIIRGTAMEKQYAAAPERFASFTMDSYLQLLADILERLNPAIVVERIAGETAPGRQVREGWGKRYDEVVRRFGEILQERDTWQGRLWQASANQKTLPHG
ncbi:MAG: TIGR01212 family radical SAM protein [Bacteroidota bacterium]